MLRRNFLSSLGIGLFPIKRVTQSYYDNSVIMIPKDTLYRVELERTDYFGAVETVIEYRKNGLLHNTNGPAQIVRGPQFLELYWLVNGIKIQGVVIGENSVSYWQVKHRDIVWNKNRRVAQITDFDDPFGPKPRHITNCSQEWFEKQIGMTFKDLYSFN